MKVAINQPAYIPWLGWFQRVKDCDTFVFLDHVPMGKDGMANRNKIRTALGDEKLLTIPIRDRGGCTPIIDIEIAEDGKWGNRHFEAMRNAYKAAPYWKRHAPFFEGILAQRHVAVHLDSVIMPITFYMLQNFNIETKCMRSSPMGIKGKKSDLNLEICQKLGADTYLSGPFGRSYLETEKFDAAGVKIEYHDYQHPTYTQHGHADFLPYMSAVDWMFNHEGFPS